MLFCPIVVPRIRALLRPTVHEAAAPYSLGSLAGYATIGVSRIRALLRPTVHEAAAQLLRFPGRVCH